MKSKSKVPTKGYRMKVGIVCPACQQEIFSMHRHDFHACDCGSVFVDGGDDYLRYGALKDIIGQIRTVRRRFPVKPVAKERSQIF
jgi:hypothetical protein